MVEEDLPTHIERTLVYIMQKVCIFSLGYLKDARAIILLCIPPLWSLLQARDDREPPVVKSF